MATVTDGQMDRQTDGRRTVAIPHYAHSASRGKNRNKICKTQDTQESRAVARKPRNAAAVLFGLKFADNIHYKFKSR